MQCTHETPGGMPPAARAAQPRLRCHGPDEASRPAVQAFIAAVYAQRFGARVPRWAPSLVSLENDGEIIAAAGYRAGSRALYLERYLGRPIESAIAAHAPEEVRRATIAEIGHLAATSGGAARQLMLALGEHLAAQGFRWAAMTATSGLRTLFARLRVQSIVLAPAQALALGREADAWGSYYTHAPQVIVGEIAPNLERLREALR